MYSMKDRYSANSTLRIDPLEDVGTCVRDIPHLLQLGINTLLVLDLNIDRDHSACIELLKKAGVYILAQLGSNGLNFRLNGEVTFSADRVLLEHHTKIINSLQKHSNVLGFFITLSDFSPAIIDRSATWKAMIRDLKQHIKVKGYRPIPIGALGIDHYKSIFVSEFMCCGSSEIAADFYGFYFSTELTPNHHPGWCSNSTVYLDGLAERYRDFAKPVILSYGCDYRVAHRFDEVRHMYSDNMTDIFSGAIADEWFNNLQGIGVDSGSDPTFICCVFCC
jgi:1,3-beta-glucanosyltransferase GAS1